MLVKRQGDEDAAITLFRRAIGADPDCPPADAPLGRLLEQRGDLDGALICYQRAIRLRPKDAQARHGLGRVLHRLGALPDAVASYAAAVQLAPDLAEAHSDLGEGLRRLGRIASALDACQRAVALKPDLAEAHNHLGNALRDEGELAAAAASYDSALALRPEWAEAHNNLANVLAELGRTAAAVEHYQRALSLKPDLAEAHVNFGNALVQCGRLDEAEATYQRALSVKPGYPPAVVQQAQLRAELCEWRDADADAARVRDILRRHPAVVPPWNLQWQPSTPAEQLLCARQWSERVAAGVQPRFCHQRPAAPRKVRLGYISADFRDHPVGYALAETIERHDRARFEVAGYSYGPDDGSPLRRRFEVGFDRFVDLRTAHDGEAAVRIYRDGIDILIDLTGYTRLSRPRIAARRPAPIQVNLLGFLGTMGADFIDYILVDRFIATPSQQPFYSERLVHLSGCWWPSEIGWDIAQEATPRSIYGLPRNGFVFCCFSTSYKITPPVFDVWMRLLRRVPGSVLWLAGASDKVAANLRREAAQRAVDPARLVFAPREPMADYLARHQHADLFLDTLPYNAVGTAFHALLAGLPLLTCVGQTFASRTAGTILQAAGLPELVTHSLAEYERLALQLAQTPGLLTGLRRRLAQARLAAPLFDRDRFARDSETAYLKMWEIWRAGEPPRPFSVAPAG